MNLLLAEYTLATGDRAFVPDMQRITMEIVHGQSGVGSWGHRFTTPGEQRLSGYGMMNSPGIPLTISLVLARKAGITYPELDEAIEAAIAETGATTAKQMGAVMTAAKAKLGGKRADGKLLSEKVKARLA